MKKTGLLYILFLLIGLYSSAIYAQSSRYYQRITHIVTEKGDTAILVITKPVYCFPKRTFKNQKEKEYYWRNVRNVKKVLPYAKLVHQALIETYEYIQTLPEDQRSKHLKRMEKELFEEYKPILKDFTYEQAKLLIRLIDRECNQSSYHLIKAFLGGFRASFWQTFGAMFGVSLRKEWEPEGKDKMLEEIVILVENGQL
ncbi:MAG: DUF4294 domain-containing protein [Porphyromonadaceae bacterium]|nr:DUF4294 domain-containing protein [Porphyromonadaceae bacterium]